MREITCYVQGHNRNTTRLGVTLHSCMRCISSIKWYVLYLQLTLLVSLQTEELWEPLTTWPNQINRWYWFTVRTMCSITFISIWCHLRQGRDPNRLVLSLSLTRLFSIFYSLPPSLQECARATCKVCLATSDWWAFYPGLPNNVYDPSFEF